MKRNYLVILFYKYTDIADPQKLLQNHTNLCHTLKLKGRIIIAKEGINGTLEGLKEDAEQYILEVTSDPQFENIHFKKSIGTGRAFPKLSIKIRGEIVSGHLNNDIKPTKLSGKYLTPEQLHKWITEGKKFYLVDMRNNYEHASGYFKNSILAPFENFRDLPRVLPVLSSLKDQTIVTVCTGGVRCEKASGFLLQNGFKDVYQLYGGIVSYMEKYPNENFLGKLYVFDGRVTLGFNIDDPKHQIVGECSFCGNPADSYYDCKNIRCQDKRHFISCDKCIKRNKGYCHEFATGGTLLLCTSFRS